MQPLGRQAPFANDQTKSAKSTEQPSWLKRLETYAEPASRFGFVLTMMIFAAAAIYGLALSDRTSPFLQEFAGLMDQAAFEAGFRVEGLSMAGNQNTPSQDVFDALQLPYQKSIMSYDTSEARKRLMALGWVEKADVRRVFPSRLEVTLVERVPFARYAVDGKIELIDEKGALLGESHNPRFDKLLLVEGEGAPAEAATLSEALRGRDALRAKIERAEFVAERFWIVKLEGGLAVKLPRKVNALIVERLETLLASHKIAAMDLNSIDLRLPHRTILQLKDATPVNRDRALAMLMPGFQTLSRYPSSALTSSAPPHALLKAKAP